MGSGDTVPEVGEYAGADEALRADAVRLATQAPSSWQLGERKLCDSVLEVSAQIARW
ncbi:hypothetical protein [Rhodococcus sp. NPDC058521]|uniref:hypothetical protein n=1 Tax=Rhodococcus sp. NPDC058521 TaxID=3346536 RepID=UPI0036693F14